MGKNLNVAKGPEDLAYKGGEGLKVANFVLNLRDVHSHLCINKSKWKKYFLLISECRVSGTTSAFHVCIKS